MDPMVLGGMVAAFVVFFVLVAMSVSMYQKCGPNQAMIITGYGAAPFKIVREGGAVVLPLLQQRHLLSLEPMEITVNDSVSMSTKEGSAVVLSGRALVSVGPTDEEIARAAESLLSKSAAQINTIASDILIKGLRGYTRTQTLSDTKNNPEQVAAGALELVRTELAKYGLAACSLTIYAIHDKQ